MFDEVPVRVWLLIAIAAAAFGPARYVFLHIAHSPSRRDITQPAEDLTWRTSAQLGRSLAVLAGLAALAVFIFTPSAEELARSPRFWPILMLGIGVWAVSTVVGGFASGRIQPFVQGLNDTYTRDAQPKRFWASMAWNGLFSAVAFWAAHLMNEEASVERLAASCTSGHDVQYLHEQISACDEWIQLRPQNADPYFERGLIFLDFGDYTRAVADFTRAHKLDPDDPWALANRGVTYAWMRDQPSAKRDFAAARLIDPTNPVLLRGEAILKMHSGDLGAAVEFLTQSMNRDPDNLWALRTRSELYWDLGEHEKSAADDRRWVELKRKARLDAS